MSVEHMIALFIRLLHEEHSQDFVDVKWIQYLLLTDENLWMSVIYVIGHGLLSFASHSFGWVRLNSVCKIIHIAISAMFISRISFIYQDGIPVLLNFQWLIVVISFRVFPLVRTEHTPTPPQSQMFVRHSVLYFDKCYKLHYEIIYQMNE